MPPIQLLWVGVPVALIALGLGWDRGPMPARPAGRALRAVVLLALAAVVAEFWAYLVLLAPAVMFVVAIAGSHRSRVPARMNLPLGPPATAAASVADAPVSSLPTVARVAEASVPPTEVSYEFVDEAELDVRDQNSRRRDWQQFRIGSRASP